eukprot:CAMPEP_0114249850 /NCGR_PEP_ID=MMETSP0058-20121206/14377_1 /TAXON_ID=36894 /ORGANISM="Pyramimonas parkeae, CCMP726" /LENGTH=265 /DNA_ID=CAMNT_0001363453 /DNA_START=313 /DNA_END=1110 /DNA_ORIENTATION=+
MACTMRGVRLSWGWTNNLRCSSLGSGKRDYDDSEWNEALRLCAEIMQEASALAQQQARAELMAALTTDAVDAGKEARTPAARAAPLVVTLLELQSFWNKVGLKSFQGEALSRRLVDMHSPYADVALLSAKFDRLRRCLPDVDVAQLVRTDPDILHAETRPLVMRLLEIYDTFAEAGTNVPAMIQACPRVLYCDEFALKVASTVESILFIYPKLQIDWALQAVGDEPEMIFQLPQYEVKKNLLDISELNMDLQNMLAWSTRQKYGN